MAVCPKWTIFALVMKTRQELTEVLDFIAEYATYLLGSGVHTSRVIRNSQRIGASQGVDLQLSSFQKSTIITAHDEESGEAITRVVKIPALQLRPERPELGCAGRRASALRNPEALRRTDCKTAHRPNLRPADRGAGQRLVLPAVRGRLDRHGHRLHLDARGFRRQTAYAGTRREPLPDLHHFGFHGVAVRLGSPEVRLLGGNGARDERPVPRPRSTAHQRRDRHRRGAHSDRVQPPDQRPAAYHLHRHRPVGDIVNG